MIAIDLPAMINFRQIALRATGLEFQQTLSSVLLPEEVEATAQADFRSQQKGFSTYMVVARHTGSVGAIVSICIIAIGYIPQAGAFALIPGSQTLQVWQHFIM